MTEHSDELDLTSHIERIKELSGRALEVSRRNGLAWLDAYEKMLDSFLKLQQQAAGSTQLDWVNTLVQSNADMVRQLSQAYLGAAREQLTKPGL